MKAILRERGIALSSISILTLAIIVGAPGEAGAEFLNGGFEQGGLGAIPGWEGIGDFGASGPNLDELGINPTQGSQLGYLSTTSAFGAVPVGEIEEFFDFPPGLFEAAGIDAASGSALKQSMDLSLRDVILFDYNFVTFEAGEDALNDLAIFAVISNLELEGVFYFIADITSAFVPTANPDAFQTGWINGILPTAEIEEFTPGSYTLGFVAVNTGDTQFDSYLFLDNLRVTVIPEPASLVGLVLGLSFVLSIGATIHRWRRLPVGRA